MNDRSFFVHDSTLIICASGGGKGEHDWETYRRLLDVTSDRGFVWSEDPRIMRHHDILAKWHALGRKGELQIEAEIYPAGCKFAFFQDLVTVNRHGGRYDFDRVAKMPYLVRKLWEGTIASMSEHLLGRGLACRTKLASPVRDPLAWFNQTWDGEYERRRGTHRFKRDASGFPDRSERIGAYALNDADGIELQHGDLRYARDRKGYLLRGRVFGGIGGQWLFIYGPGLRDYTSFSSHQLFSCSPATVPRKAHPDPRRARTSVVERLGREMQVAAAARDFERAIKLRDAAKRIEQVAA